MKYLKYMELINMSHSELDVPIERPIYDTTFLENLRLENNRKEELLFKLDRASGKVSRLNKKARNINIVSGISLFIQLLIIFYHYS